MCVCVKRAHSQSSKIHPHFYKEWLKKKKEKSRENMQLKKKEAMLKEKKKKVSHLCFRPTTGHLTSFKDYMDTLQFKKNKQTGRGG